MTRRIWSVTHAMLQQYPHEEPIMWCENVSEISTNGTKPPVQQNVCVNMIRGGEVRETHVCSKVHHYTEK